MTTPIHQPEHQNPCPERVASAPYNFVPLPEKIISVVDDAENLPRHDEYDRDRCSGYFDVTLTTRSPLYIRGPLPAKDFPHQEQDALVKNKPEFFYTGDERTPVIPGSSLRGMLRALLEIVSYSKVQWVSDKQLFFRTVDRTSVGSYYTDRMVESDKPRRTPVYHTRVGGGFFRIRKNGTYFIDTCTVARVETDDLVRLFKLNRSSELTQLDARNPNKQGVHNSRRQREHDPNQTPSWLYQHQKIWANIDKDEKSYFFQKQMTNDKKHLRHPDLYLRFRRARDLAKTSEQGKRSGTLVLTGTMPNKHLAFLFVPLDQSVSPVEVPNDPQEQDANKRLVDRFNDNDQLTQWQIKAFPAARPSADKSSVVSPQSDGHLQDGDPVFFLLDENGDLVFFGRAQMFRLPYIHSPLGLVDSALRDPKQIDYAESLFGFVRTRQQLDELGNGVSRPKQGKRGRSYAGRVFVTDAVLQPSDQADIWLTGDFQKSIVPGILASPKPTAFQHYLTQQKPDGKKELNHYDSTPAGGSPTTTIRGHKLYWHQGLGNKQDLGAGQGLDLEQIRKVVSDESAQKGQLDTQHTRIKPLRPGVTFTFRVSFENLSACELGALCWTLHPRGERGQRYCHHLGMGKPLGMGSVELHAYLHLIDRELRYITLFDDDTWRSGEFISKTDASRETWSPEKCGEASMGEDLARPDVLEHRTRAFERHLLHELNPYPRCERLSDMLRIAMLLKLLEWPGYRAVEGKDNRYLEAEKPPRPNTRYMKIQPNEYRDRYVLPDPRLFDEPYFKNKSRPQDSAGSSSPRISSAPANSAGIRKTERAKRGLE